MTLKIFTTGLLLGLIVSCNGTKQNHMVHSTAEQQESKPKISKSTNTPRQLKDSELTEISAKPQGAVGKAAKLTPDQVKQLTSLDNKNNRLSINFKVVVPTYIPAGFKVDTFKVMNDTNAGPEYRIIYRNSSNSCFQISGDSGQWGGPPGGYDTVEVSSPALGKVVLEYTDFDRETNKPYITFKGAPLMRGQTGYNFLSSGLSADNQNCGNVISIQEAVKVVKSVQYLNP